MEKQKIEVGDMVRISSNTSVHMTVDSINSDGYKCVWFDDTNHIVQYRFEGDCLILVSKKPKE